MEKFRKEVSNIMEGIRDGSVMTEELVASTEGALVCEGPKGNNMARCLLEKVGSCLGCNVANMIDERGRIVCAGKEISLITRVGRSLCPEGNLPMIPVRARQSIW